MIFKGGLQGISPLTRHHLLIYLNLILSSAGGGGATRRGWIFFSFCFCTLLLVPYTRHYSLVTSHHLLLTIPYFPVPVGIRENPFCFISSRAFAASSLLAKGPAITRYHFSSADIFHVTTSLSLPHNSEYRRN